MVTLILVIIFTLLLSAFFSGTEIAFITANKLGVEIERDKGTRRSKLISGFYSRPKQFLSTILVGNNIVLVIYTYCMTLLIEPVIVTFIPSEILRLIIVILVSSLIILMVGEYFPKIIFRTFANRTLMLVSYPVVFFQWILKLPVWVMMSVSNLLMKYVFRVPINHVEDVFTRLDLQDYVEGSLTGDQDELEADMFKNALQLKNLKARECMVPRTEIVHVDLEDGIDEVKKVFIETRHSRILVSKGDIDNILGYIHHQNLLQDQVSIEKMIIPIQHIPEVTSVLDIMTMFTRQKNNIAVVVDEFGGTAGIITLEDITEEIFGEIEDEHDQEDYLEEKISETEYLFSARLEIDYLNTKYPALKFPVGEYETLSGYIVMTSGEIPELDKDFELDDYRFVIEKVTNKKIEEVRVFLINTQD
ncbi:MAG: HlyC/CorC family transporter [Saprospiraceae bacterium]|nr:HlyC/CorC family transporter [Candidatus Opimibacter skivensis]MBP6681123.1 HlyC/CorC family transporter [Saprospiraceae bacterium]MBP8086136.1 HlyC/CorC family transporter [Saprospiraceae bacterium]